VGEAGRAAGVFWGEILEFSEGALGVIQVGFSGGGILIAGLGEDKINTGFEDKDSGPHAGEGPEGDEVTGGFALLTHVGGKPGGVEEGLWVQGGEGEDFSIAC